MSAKAQSALIRLTQLVEKLRASEKGWEFTFYFQSTCQGIAEVAVFTVKFRDAWGKEFAADGSASTIEESAANCLVDLNRLLDDMARKEADLARRKFERAALLTIVMRDPEADIPYFAKDVASRECSEVPSSDDPGETDA